MKQVIGFILMIQCLMWAIIMAIKKWDVPLMDRFVGEWPWWILYIVVGYIGWQLAFNPRLFGGGK